MINNDARYTGSLLHPSSYRNPIVPSPVGINPRFETTEETDEERQIQSPSRPIVKNGKEIIEIMTHSSSDSNLDNSGKKKKRAKIAKNKLDSSSVLKKRMMYQIDQKQLSKEAASKLPPDTP